MKIEGKSENLLKGTGSQGLTFIQRRWSRPSSKRWSASVQQNSSTLCLLNVIAPFKIKIIE